MAKALAAMAAMFQTSLPEPQGIALYVMALDDVPAPAFKLACRSLVKTHKWPRLPYPAEIRDAAEAHAAILRAWEARLTRALMLAS